MHCEDGLFLRVEWPFEWHSVVRYPPTISAQYYVKHEATLAKERLDLSSFTAMGIEAPFLFGGTELLLVWPLTISRCPDTG